MGVDMATYRGRIGTFRVSYGFNVVLILSINFTRCLKYVGTLVFIGMLLLMAGVEPNPGPIGECWIDTSTYPEYTHSSKQEMENVLKEEITRIDMSDSATSVCLSKVMDDIGFKLNQIMERRKVIFEMECVRNLFNVMLLAEVCTLKFGSQSECSTTLGLDSDLDMANCFLYRVMETLLECEDQHTCLLMVQDERTPPGHCRLQVVKHCPEKNGMGLFKVNNLEKCDGNVFLKNTALMTGLNERTGTYFSGHGPAVISNNYMDIVCMLPCKSWPPEGKVWLRKSRPNNWPTPDMLKTIEESGFLLAPVGYPDSKSIDLEWRLSYSLTENILMFSLNETQLQCYVLLKMIKKTFIKDIVEDEFSSYHCKTSLLYNVENNADIVWDARNLLSCVSSCLKTLCTWLAAGHCPHFINPRYNLFVGKLDRSQQTSVKKKIEHLLKGNLKCILDISIDKVGYRLVCSISSIFRFKFSEDYLEQIQEQNKLETVCLILAVYYDYLDMPLSTEDAASVMYIKLLGLFWWEQQYKHIYEYGIRLMKLRGSAGEMEPARSRILSVMCAMLASLEASLSIKRGQPISTATLGLYNQGLQHDEISTKLKLASAYYCSGDLENAILLLCNVEERLPYYAATYCLIVNRGTYSRTPFTLCVKFLKQEQHNCPYELRFEMYRRLAGDETYMDQSEQVRDKFWMDGAEVSPVPFMYYLKYMTYSRLHQPQMALEARDALNKLLYNELDKFQRSEVDKFQRSEEVLDLLSCPKTIPHLETGFNLLGQIYEQEKNINLSFMAYINSLRIRPRNNATKWLIAKLVYSLVNSDRGDERHVLLQNALPSLELWKKVWREILLGWARRYPSQYVMKVSDRPPTDF